MTKITEEEFSKLCEQIAKNSESIIKHNPIGTPEETLLWMLLGTLVYYLNLSEVETPCFASPPTAQTYKQAILHVLRNRKMNDFDPEKYIDRMLFLK
ncbi:MAG: hypothetical protein N2Z23_07145 [Pyrinomonadaceae bacterium]|nr:hypothetical protein [Pyrinomonadaceae bacterium]MCX7640200.1 hypothetical protein [Pyrinomonadaceae bacterium]MDW8303212.1 hypothetical protein [Acidobacteriota bacterium]